MRLKVLPEVKVRTIGDIINNDLIEQQVRSETDFDLRNPKIFKELYAREYGIE